MKKFNHFFIVFLLLFSVSGCSDSEKTTMVDQKPEVVKNEENKVVNQKLKEEDMFKSFDNNIELLPSNYRGNDIKRLFQKFQEMCPNTIKDEYETTVEYDKRIKEINNKFRGINYAILSKDFLETEYNADKQSLIIKSERSDLIISEINHELSMGYLENDSIKYTSLYTDNWWIKSQALSGSSYPSIKLTPREAESLRNNLRGLIVFTISPSSTPFFMEEKETRYPKNSEFTSFSTDNRKIYANVISLWVFDQISGKVLAKRNFYDFTRFSYEYLDFKQNK